MKNLIEHLESSIATASVQIAEYEQKSELEVKGGLMWNFYISKIEYYNGRLDADEQTLKLLNLILKTL